MAGISSPGVVNDDCGAGGNRLDNCLGLATVFRALGGPFRQIEVDGSLVIVVVAFDEGVRTQQPLEAVPGPAPSVHLVADGSWEENAGEDEAQLARRVPSKMVLLTG